MKIQKRDYYYTLHADLFKVEAYQDSSNTAVDLTSSTVLFKIYRAVDHKLLLTLDTDGGINVPTPANGQIEILITAAQLAALGERAVYFVLTVETDSVEVPILRGELINELK